MTPEESYDHCTRAVNESIRELRATERRVIGFTRGVAVMLMWLLSIPLIISFAAFYIALRP